MTGARPFPAGRPGPPGEAVDGRARWARYAGLTGAALLAVAGYLGGALPAAPLRVTPVSIWQGPHGPIVLGAWLIGTVLLVGAWWSLRQGAPSTGWAYRTAGLWAVPLLVTPPMGSRDVYSYACQGWTYAHGLDPYATGVAAAGCPWLDTVAPIWRDTPAPYGPLFVLLAALAVLLGGGLTGTIVLLRLIAVVGVLLAALCLPGLARAAGVPTRRAAWLLLACPLVGVHLVAGAHNDAMMLGLLLLGLLVLVRYPGRPRPLVIAGVLLGLAVAVKASALVVLPFAALAALLGRYTVRALLRDAGWLAGGVVAALLATSLLSGLGLGWVGGLSRSGESVQWTSPPTAVGFVVDYAGALFGREPDAVPVIRAVALVVLAGLLVALWWRAWAALRRLNDARQRVARLAAARSQVTLRLAGLALAATVVLAPVFHPWYATWPLALLAVAVATRTTWFVLPCAVASCLTLPDGTNLARFTKAPGALAMTALLLVLLTVTVTRRLRASRAPTPTPTPTPTPEPPSSRS
ncbi:polyprenol phosphomannose-dependent alpha 1,6 mannosyltransferase MptB [Micromonospora sp. WMMD812]|uniref:polyprenol phosphomannose-dependent alpha 1,6 mannosyltransferase MptB n=1 Tax=Micromonospora sp. WMMD812 TaxID=3015152 RepID=UPI00248AF273|nr:polyprenol phosphomannose-dependent alpha 1,6 mannosyltransferase MptB [Micromonospora sp. WMMD812]WBB67139.1 polyprenol phosphomannose-dependent alpha 1,6 mannosyltransferase MptB [Micromonospora sp. WMMD812]